MKAAARKGVTAFVGIAVIMVSFLSGCSSHDKAVRKYDYDMDSKKISQLAETSAQGKLANAKVSPPADLTADAVERDLVFVGQGR